MLEKVYKNMVNNEIKIKTTQVLLDRRKNDKSKGH